MAKQTNIGFAGVGMMGQCAHLRNYTGLPDCRVVALAEPRAELARLVAEKYRVDKVYANAEEMLNSEKLDGIVAPQQFIYHVQLLAPLFRFGVPVLSEKPLASSLENGKKMLAALKAGGSWHMVGYHKRSDPATEYAKAEIERLKANGELGALRYIRVLMPSGDWMANGFFDLLKTEEKPPMLPWDEAATDMDEATFGKYVSFVNFYIHQVNLMRHLLGEPYKVTYAEPSGVLLAVQSESGIAGTLEMSPYNTTLGWQESVLIAFEKGYVKLELPSPMALNVPGRVEILRDPGNGVEPTTTVPTLRPVHAMRAQAENFVAAIRGEKPPMCHAAEAQEDLRVAHQYIKMMSNNTA